MLALAVAMAVGIASFSFAPQAAPTTADPGRAADGVMVVVQPGDTLWQIATDLTPGTDPRPLVAALGELLDGSGLQPGQELVIPASLLG